MELQGPDPDAALADLYDLLVRGLGARAEKAAQEWGICKTVQTPATHERSLVAGAGISGSSPLVGSPFYLQIL